MFPWVILIYLLVYYHFLLTLEHDSYCKVLLLVWLISNFANDIFWQIHSKELLSVVITTNSKSTIAINKMPHLFHTHFGDHVSSMDVQRDESTKNGPSQFGKLTSNNTSKLIQILDNGEWILQCYKPVECFWGRIPHIERFLTLSTVLTMEVSKFKGIIMVSGE